MARQEIILGTAPTGLGGDPPRTASQKINFMTQELYDENAALGTAAKRDVQTSSLDATAGRVLVVGAFGIGLQSSPALPGGNANTSPPGGTYFTGSAWAGSIYPGTNANNQGYLIVSPWSLLTYAKQQWSSINTPAGSFERYLVAGVWSDWFRVYTSATAIGLIANGGIIERGATANGQYTKYADGTLICWTDTLVASSRTATYMLAVWALPSPFMGTLPCVITVTARQNDPGTSDFPVAERGKGTLYGKLTSNSQAFVGFLTSSTNSFSVGTEIPLSAMAVGRWKA